ncbi:AAA family ATPase [Terrilactibacillus sp. S3-3]|nr:AAA family ATPase [Terrilactibacillus sp. S3-3]
MLTEIRCDKFAAEHQTVRFNPGLNTVLGSAEGSNAIGKSTFLWIIDYAFGGESYYSMSDDIKKEIGPHTIYFTFQFEGQHTTSTEILMIQRMCAAVIRITISLRN